MKIKSILFLAFLCAHAMYLTGYGAEMPEYSRTDYPIHDVARFIYTGSENDDSRPDVIVVDKSGAINVLLAGPNTVYETAIVTETGISEPKATVVDDFDNDGLTDICIDGTMFVATGYGRFDSSEPIIVGNILGIASGDMNGDGFKDIIAIVMVPVSPTNYSTEIRTYIGNGDGSFKEPVSTEIADDGGNDKEYTLLYAGDLTNDRIPDVVILYEYTNYGNIFTDNMIFTGIFDGSFANVSTYFNYRSFVINAHDYNNDGNLDLLFGNQFGSVWLQLGDGHGKFSTSWGITVSEEIISNEYIFARAFASSDVNGDNISDLVIIYARHGYSEIEVKIGKSDGSYYDIQELNIHAPFNFLRGFGYQIKGEKEMISSYINNDKYSDFVVSHRDSAYLAVILSNNISTYINSNNKPFASLLNQNIPNPFNASTIIPYSIQTPGIYKLAVYDILGRKIATLFSGFQSNGEHRVVWNGKTGSGEDSASGIYFYILSEKGGKGLILSKRLLLMK